MQLNCFSITIKAINKKNMTNLTRFSHMRKPTSVRLQNITERMFPVTKPKHQSVLFMKKECTGKINYSWYHQEQPEKGS